MLHTYSYSALVGSGPSFSVVLVSIATEKFVPLPVYYGQSKLLICTAAYEHVGGGSFWPFGRGEAGDLKLGV